MMNIKHVLNISIFSCLLALNACSNSEKKEQPNVVIILTDDQGWGDIASHGNPDIETPVLDGMAKSGAWFERFFVSPVCAPTRASLLTGRDHLRTGTQWVTYGLENMRSEEVTFGEVFKKAGYETSMFGKWHNGSHYPMDPKGQGFDTFFGFKKGHFNNYFDSELEYNGEPVETEGYITDVLTDSALSFIEQNKNTPFLTYIPYNAPHSPFQVPDRYFDKYKAKGLSDKNASVYGMVENIDDNIGRILKKLDDLDLTKNTIVIFMTDNGPNGGDRYNGEMKGWKAKVDEGGVRVPLFIRWPGKIESGTVVEELTAHIDFLPSIADLAGIKLPDSLNLDGRSFAPLIFEQDAKWPDRFLYTHQSRWDSLEQFPASVRNNRYRLVRYGDNWELYDMQMDPFQRKDISTSEPGIVDSLSAAYGSWFEEVTQNLKGRNPIPVGYDESPDVTLPAVESYFSDEIEFFGKSGWSNDWLTNWNSTESKIWWEMDVVKSGEFEVSLDYTLQNGDENVLVQVNSDSQKVSKVITQPFDPDFEPSPDRVERGEVYEKEWARLNLGTMHLTNGIQKISLQSLTIPGEESIEVKSLNLSRIN